MIISLRLGKFFAISFASDVGAKGSKEPDKINVGTADFTGNKIFWYGSLCPLFTCLLLLLDPVATHKSFSGLFFNFYWFNKWYVLFAGNA